MKDLLLAIDQGTSGCKMTIFDTMGNVIADCTKSYQTFYPKEYYVEQNCNDWWDVIVQGIKEMISEKNINPSYIKAIGVDGISWACIPIDKKGDVLHPTMIWLDQRAKKQVDWMNATIGEDVLIELSGNPVNASYLTPKILWLKENEKDIYDRTYKFLQSNSFIVYRLTGVLSQDYSQCYGYHFFDIKKGEFNKKVADQLGLSLEKMAPLYESHEVVGGVTKEVAEITGLLQGTPVVAGGLDAACCTLGAGVINVGQAQEQGGQAGGMSIVLDEPQIHSKLILGKHVVPGKWLLQGGTTGGGGTLNWLKREFGDSFTIMSEEADSINAGSEGVIFLPYMKGERSPIWCSEAKGVYYGLSYDKSKAHMIRSTMEGVAYSLKHNIETAEEMDIIVKTLRSVGGSSNSQVWTQIKADVSGKEIEVPFSDHATSLGTAILAGVGIGLYKDFNEAVEKTVKVKKYYEPNEANIGIYKKGYELYMELSKILLDKIWRK